MASTDVERFLAEAVERGHLTPAQAADCRRIALVLDEVGVKLTIEKIAQRKGFLGASAAAEIQRALARRRVGKYEVLEQLGQGGAGVVWRARDTTLDRIVALKVLSRGDDPDSRYHQRFLREARIAVTLNHVNIVRGLDYGETDGYCFFAMEFVAGESVSRRLRREGRIEEQEALRITRDVVRALEHVQRFGLVHRDIKPANLLVTPAGDVKVCDLGLAKPSLEEIARMSGSGSTAGTPRYMSPEQIQDPERLDWRADCYSLGASLYHMLTGVPPFVPSQGRSVIHQHLHDPPRDPREVVIDLSSGAAAVVLKMLQKSPDERYASLDDLAADLESVMDGRPPVHTVTFAPRERPVVEALVDRAPTSPESYRRRARRRRLAFVGGAAVAGLLAFGGWRLYSDPGAEAAAPPPRVPEEPSPPAPRGPAAEPSPPESDPVPDPGRDALAGAERLESDPDADLVDLIRQYAFVVERYPDSPSGRTARERLEPLRVRLESLASSALMKLRYDTDRGRTLGRYGAVIAAFEAFPGRYDGTRAATQVDEEIVELRESGRRHVGALLAEAQALLDTGELAEARAFVAEAEAVGMPGMAAEVVRVRTTVDVAFEERALQREADRPRYEMLYGRALLAAGRDGAGAARELVAAAGPLPAYTVELAELGRHLDAFERVEDALFAAWDRMASAGEEVDLDAPGARGGRVRGHVDGVTERRLSVISGTGAVRAVDPAALSTAALRSLVADEIDDEDPLDQLALYLYLLGKGNLDAARDQLGVLEKLVDLSETSLEAGWRRVRAAAVVQADEIVARAEVARRQGRLADARTEIAKALRLLPSHAPTHLSLGLLHADLGALEDAAAALERALELDGTPPETRFHLGQVLARSGDHADAETHLRAYLADTPGATFAEEARSALERVVAQRTAIRVKTLRNSARRELRAGRTADAERSFAAVLELEPTDAEALLELGRIYDDTQRVFPAYRALTLFVTHHPRHRSVREAERTLGALSRFLTTTTFSSKRVDSAIEAQREGRLDDAIAAYRAALSSSPFYVRAHYQLGLALIERGRRSGAREDLLAGERSLSDVLLIRADNLDAHRERSRARLLLGRFEDALSDAALVLEGREGDWEAAVLAGRAHFELGRLDEAAASYERAIERNPGAAEPKFRMALVLERRGRPGRARRLVTQIYEDGVPAELEDELEDLHRRLPE